jgi:hypothetical protein
MPSSFSVSTAADDEVRPSSFVMPTVVVVVLEASADAASSALMFAEY